MRRVVLGMMTLLAAACSAQPAARVDAADHDAFYLWAGVEPQPVLATAKTIYLLDGEVRADNANFLVPLRPSAPRIGHAETWLVVRAARLDWGPEVYAAIARDLRRWQAAGSKVVGLQVDFDATTPALGDYAAFLGDLRQRLPKTYRLSVTGLMDWSANADPAALAQLKGVVDEVVVQSYQGTTTIPGYARYLERLSRVPVPHKVALVQGGEWREPAALRSDPLFTGYVVFLRNP